MNIWCKNENYIWRLWTSNFRNVCVSLLEQSLVPGVTHKVNEEIWITVCRQADSATWKQTGKSGKDMRLWRFPDKSDHVPQQKMSLHCIALGEFGGFYILTLKLRP